MVRDGVTLTQIGVMFDEEITTRAEWVGKGADGFPVLEGKFTEVVGQSLMIRYSDTHLPRVPSEPINKYSCHPHPRFLPLLLHPAAGMLIVI